MGTSIWMTRCRRCCSGTFNEARNCQHLSPLNKHSDFTGLTTSSFPRGITYNFKYFCPKKYSRDFDKHLTKILLKDFQLFSTELILVIYT